MQSFKRVINSNLKVLTTAPRFTTRSFSAHNTLKGHQQQFSKAQMMVDASAASSHSAPAQEVPLTNGHSQFRVAIVSSSSRKPRLNPYVTEYISSLIRSHDSAVDTGAISLKHIDLGSEEYTLPLDTNEPLVPAQLPREDPTPHYTSSRIREWSATVQSFDAFIFVSPQYNWSYPATLKNALDLLFWEWNGKAAAVVTYGMRGGTMAGDHLARVLGGGLHMNVVGGKDGQGMPSVAIGYKTMEETLEAGTFSSKATKTAEENGLPEKVAAMWSELKNLAATKSSM